MNVLITGATGFIGSHVAEALVAEGHDVRVLVRASSDTRWLDALDVQRRTAGSNGELASAVEGVDAVVHAAGVTRGRDRGDFLAGNAELTARVVDACERRGGVRFVLVSSLAARGPDQAHAPGDSPVSWYGASKLLAERALLDATERGAVAGIVLRLGGVYGPRDTDLLPLFRAASWGVLPLPPRGLQAQPVHVADATSAISAALRASAGFGPWPVSHPEVHPWASLGRKVAASLGRSVLPLHVPRPVFLAVARASEAVAAWRRSAPRLDLRRAEDLAQFSYTTEVEPTMAALGWRPMWPAEAGLRDTAAWYRANGWLP